MKGDFSGLLGEVDLKERRVGEAPCKLLSGERIRNTRNKKR